MLLSLCGCPDDPEPPAGSGSETDGSTGAQSDTEPTTASSSMSSTTVDPTTDPSETSTSTNTTSTDESSSSGAACEPDFEPIPAGLLPRCEAATLDCWLGCAGLDPHVCTSACAAADPMPGETLEDGSTLDCGRCINKMFGTCWHEACPQETLASHCCTVSSGCDAQCIESGPCDEEDLQCIRDACGPELAAQSACLMETGALETCRLQNDGLAIACFAPAP